MTNIEIWKDIPNYEGLYQVSNLGRVKSIRFGKERLFNPFTNPRGYSQVGLRKNKLAKKITIHQLVAMAFLNHIPCGLKLVVNHKNLIKTDNRLDNLEIISNRENLSKKHIPHSSKYTGVSWFNRKQKWQSSIYINGKSKYLGCFINEYEAHLAYEKEKLTFQN
jgi:hypothetical protein